MDKYPFRQNMLEELDGYVADDMVSKVEWLSARDGFECPECVARNGKVYTLDEMRKLIMLDYCHPKDKEQTCRCTLMPVVDLEKV
jgi:hypothetical protein